MKRDRIDDILKGIDECLEDLPPVTCWRCDEAPGEPSTCAACKADLGVYEMPPKGTKRKPWKTTDQQD